MNNENTATAVPVDAVEEVSTLTPVASFKDIAMPLIVRHIPVIPTQPGEKSTSLKNWPELASTEPLQIDKWNNENQKYNVGAVAKSDGFWFLDCDVPNLQQTIETETGQVLPQTFSVKSGNGLHFYFKHTATSRALKKNKIQLKDEQGNVMCDVQLNNSYVVGPGSLHPSGKRYEIVNDAEIIEAPDWLVTWIKQRHKHSQADEKHAGLNGQKVKEGGRNTFLFEQVCKLRTSALSQANALVALRAINDSTCVPPLEEAELSKIVDSAYSYEPNKNALQELIQQPDKPSHTDLGNAKRLVAAEGENIRYCYEIKKWFVWDGRIWSKDDSGKIHRLAKQTVKGMLHEAADLQDEEERKLLVSHEQRCESEGRLNAMVSLARWQEGIHIKPTDFDRDPMLFNCLNGTLDLRTGESQPHSRQEFISKMAPVEYDPKKECPNWLKFLDIITDGQVELAHYLQRCAGYSLTGKTSEHVLFLLHGTGANEFVPVLVESGSSRLSARYATCSC